MFAVASLTAKSAKITSLENYRIYGMLLSYKLTYYRVSHRLSATMQVFVLGLTPYKYIDIHNKAFSL